MARALILCLVLAGCTGADYSEPGGFILGDEVEPPRGLTEMLEREGIDCERREAGDTSADTQECQ